MTGRMVPILAPLRWAPSPTQSPSTCADVISRRAPPQRKLSWGEMRVGIGYEFEYASDAPVPLVMLVQSPRPDPTLKQAVAGSDDGPEFRSARIEAMVVDA